ncbi:MAG: transglutaminase domain-containing protein [Planctomycetes bacterium]|nr:transglutaminase domain-containing protein [Planctomycetota bacterium]
MFKKSLAACLLAVSFSFASSARDVPPAEKVLEDSWYVLKVGDRTAGSTHITVTEASAAGVRTFRTAVEEIINLDMGIQALSIASTAVFVENSSGAMLSFSYSTDDGVSPKTVRGVVEDGSIVTTTTSGGRSYTRRRPVSPDILTGYSEEKLVRSNGFTPGASYSYESYSPEIGPITVTRTVMQPETLSVAGRSMRLNRIDVSGILPGVTITEYRDDSGRTVASRTPVFGMEFMLELTSEQAARSARSRAASMAGIDLMGLRYATLVQPHPRPRRVDSATFFIDTVENKPFSGLDLSGPGQKMKLIKDGIVLDVSFPPKDIRAVASPSPPSAEHVPAVGVDSAPRIAPPPGFDPAYLRPGPYIQCDLPEIKRRSEDVVLNSSDYVAAAVRLERWVRENIVFVGAGMNFAPAAVILKERRGDCTEAAVLLASLMRSAGIPCRLVAGVVQLRGQLGFHMWVEVWAGSGGSGEVWIPFDSAVPSGSRVDATHIRLAAVHDDADALGAMAPLVQIVGRLRVTGVRYSAQRRHWEEGRDWLQPADGRLVHDGFLVSFPVLPDMRPSAPASDGSFRFVDTADPAHSLSVSAQEMPPEYRLSETLERVAARGWQILRKEYSSLDGRRELRMVLAKGDRKIKVSYIHDSDSVIRIAEEPHMPAHWAFREIVGKLSFVGEAGYE